MLALNVCVAITNYDFSENAENLKHSFAPFFPTILIDSDSPQPPKTTDISIVNNFYPGLWNASVNYAILNKFDWLMFIASDLQISDAMKVCNGIAKAIEQDWIGIYLPSLTRDSRVSFELCLNQGGSELREVFLVEGFCFLARTSILKALYPIPVTNKYGWGVDIAACYEAYQEKYSVVVDDQVVIHHPEKNPSHSINDELAFQQLIEYLGPERMGWFRRRLKSTKKYLNTP